MTLDQVPLRRRVTVSTLTMSAAEQHRLTELGMRHGVEVEVLRRAPFNGPLAVRLPGGGLLALRRAQAALIVVADGDHLADGGDHLIEGQRADV
ncbi:MAG: ferrous iron transport protein A [Nitriliruptoraceae bacterium]